MKTLSLFTLTVILAIGLNARENPFEMMNTFEEETGKMIEMNENPVTPEDMQEAQYIREMQQKMSDVNKNKVNDAVNKIVPTIKENKPVQKTYSKQEVDSLLQKTKKQTEQKTKEIVKKELANTKPAEPEQIVYVKPRPDITDDDTLVAKTLLPFLKIEFSDNKLIIHTDYKVSKKFSIIKENKLIIDYKAKVNFNTKKDDLDSKNFKRITVGNHKSEGYFRVALELIDKPSNYNVSYKDDLITISKLN
ncbi:MAG: AMIN domain-containing protein [Arcobacter sp.]|jgi:hypothetical protein|uniref:AMIN domain-containing protein n=1 Tax=Arcobacter defluvii TaxID=873191 RepID=A0AAE7BIQ1_9BACT|nr:MULTISPECIES: AMIN domain-containing protein [Arcobacter]MDY3200017.1 AMIN domain-containing protein [Arcobacter sp.]QKF78811.1 AMIN domain-containing protein [Arcobacter defluvii]RXI30471.1 AMIN domain-containing protein [Arcobacter defluvii]BAK74568.1 conserved hypothetical protein [Arcobacter sp. L]